MVKSPYRNNVPFVAFTGRFKDLIPNGWTFQKLYANNYRQYHKTCDGQPYSQGCRIWQANGGYLEIADLFSLSALVVKKIQEGKLSELQATTKKIFSDRTEVVYWWIIDEQERIIHSYNSPEYKRIKTLEYQMSADSLAGLREGLRTHFERYRSFNLSPKMIPMLQDLLDKGWITVRS